MTVGPIVSTEVAADNSCIRSYFGKGRPTPDSKSCAGTVIWQKPTLLTTLVPIGDRMKALEELAQLFEKMVMSTASETQAVAIQWCLDATREKIASLPPHAQDCKWSPGPCEGD